MSERDTGGGVFHIATVDGFSHDGMSLRDWYAGQAIIAVVTLMAAGKLQPEFPGWHGISVEAFKCAGHMLLEKDGK